MSFEVRIPLSPTLAQYSTSFSNAGSLSLILRGFLAVGHESSPKQVHQAGTSLSTKLRTTLLSLKGSLIVGPKPI